MKIVKKMATLGVAVIVAAFIFWLALGFFPNPLTETTGWDWSVKVTDREGRLLKEFLPPRTARREYRPLSEFSPSLVAAILTTEDKRFYQHLGVDPVAMFRAVWLNLSRGRIVSGASTITMQVARLNKGLTPGPRTYGRKLREIWWALLIERHNDKETILTEYLNRAPCGNLTEGFPAAAKLYLNKSVQNLSAAEGAFLAGLPASPGAFNPYKNPQPALKRRSSILKKMARKELLTPDELARAQAEPLDLSYPKNPFNAPHFVSYLHQHFEPLPPQIITTTLDLKLQQQIEELASTTASTYRNQGLSQAAVVVMSLPSRQVLAWVGSADFFGAKDGQNDGVMALRQPGSALKPFIYAAAFDKGLINPASLMADQAADYLAPMGSFSPTNYSGDYHGLVSARLALASSLNLPAVKLAAATGVNNLLTDFRALGLESLKKDANYYGLSLALGGGEVNLLSLTNAYAVLADQGRWRPPVLIKPNPDAKPEPQTNIFTPGTAFLVTDILSDPQARATGFGLYSVLNTPYPAAVKTGTSKSFRDNWCVGFTGSYVVGVWAGNFEASPMDQVSGVTGAGAIWRQVADLLAQKYPTPPFTPPAEVTSAPICPVSGLLAGPKCPNRKKEYFLVTKPAPKTCPHTELAQEVIPVLGLRRDFGVIRPLTGELYAWDPGIHPQMQRIKAQAQSVPQVDEIIWLVNGQEVKRQAVQGFARVGCLLPPTQGPVILEIKGLTKGQVTHKSQVNFMIRNEANQDSSAPTEPPEH